jgi:hypothetical protein
LEENVDDEMDPVLKRALERIKKFDPDKTDIERYVPIDDSILKENARLRALDEESVENLKRTLDPAKKPRRGIGLDDQERVRDSFTEQVKKRRASKLPIESIPDEKVKTLSLDKVQKALGKADSGKKLSALKNIAKKGGKRAASLLAGPIGLLASGAAEAFDAAEVGAGSDTPFTKPITEEDLPEDIKMARRVALAKMAKNKMAENSDLSPETKALVKSIKKENLEKDLSEEDAKRNRKIKMYQNALEDATDEDFRKRIQRQLDRLM